MTDDTTKRGEPDRIRINVNQVFERAYWTKAIGITQKESRRIVKEAGPMVSDVKKHLIDRITNA